MRGENLEGIQENRKWENTDGSGQPISFETT